MHLPGSDQQRVGRPGPVAIASLLAWSLLGFGPAFSAEVEILLPNGFEIDVVATGLGKPRHLVVRDNGDIYVALNNNDRRRGVAALRDSDGDGRYEELKRFGHDGGTGIGIHDGYLYFSSNDEVLRMKFNGDALLPRYMETVVDGFPDQRSHVAKSLALGNGLLYVNSGAPSNACQISRRTPGSAGQDPCPQLERGGGIWRFDADVQDQDQADDGLRFATGLRNAVALAWDPGTQQLYLVMHGRDDLDRLWPDYYTAKERENLPAEEFHLVVEDSNLGWPYTYYDGIQGRRMLGPEYGGDGRTPSDDPRFQDPLVPFPAHWAPNALVFYHGGQFPEAYRGGVFIAFHGSWNRAPGAQGGYQVVFQPMDNGLPDGPWQTFADGFAGQEEIRSAGDARHRPTGLAVGPDGSLFISDDTKGTIWRVRYNESR